MMQKMHTIELDTRCHIDLGLGHKKRRVEISEGVRLDMMANQADKQKILEVMESSIETKNIFILFKLPV